MDLAGAGLNVTAVEPNDRMRALGIERTRTLGNMRWIEGTAEATGLDDARYRVVSFGSSFNVVDRPRALQEARRISLPAGWFCCMWNHRVLDDPIQERIESIIKRFVPGYSYGLRREDHGPFLRESGMFRDVDFKEFEVVHQQAIEDTIEAWQSHATLARQSGRHFPDIVGEISRYLRGIGSPRIAIPYVTRIWLGQFA
ncbi:methyltransferase domain-containing protein [Thalassobaculum sp.]|uniref:class I SAM-dependent methyltransferase n=1 Tax=Thalassobaculum sp. TaxID=2022740 RepID=UPI0032ECF5EE